MSLRFAAILPAFLLLHGPVGVGQSLFAQKSEAVTSVLQPFVDREELAGAVMLVATKDKVLLLDTVGATDRAANKAMNSNAMFWIASQSKPMTAAAFMILVDEGKVSLDDPVEKYLPEFQKVMVKTEADDEHVLLNRPDQKITLRLLLSHSSGLPFKSALEEPTLDLYPLSARVRSYAMTPLDSQPGTKYQYSNAGINTAARVIEVVTGKTFEQFLDERLFQPLGMSDTTFWPSAEQAERIAKSYKPGQGGKGLEETTISQLYYPLTDKTIRTPMPAGGLFSTAEDVCKFYQMLLGEGEFQGKRILSAQAVHELTRRQTSLKFKESYGLGFSVSETTFGHGGAYSTNSMADRSKGLIYIWLVQHAGFPGEGGKCQDLFRRTASDVFAQ